MTNEDIISAILSVEGAQYTDIPDDLGGPTKYGITLRTLRKFIPGANEISVKNLTEAEARNIYFSEFIIEPGYNKITSMAVRAAVVDTAVQFNPNIATRMLQRTVNQVDDGVFGTKTEVAVNTANPLEIIKGMVKQRVEHRANRIYKNGKLVDNGSQAQFLLGWLRRDLGLLEVTA